MLTPTGFAEFFFAFWGILLACLIWVVAVDYIVVSIIREAAYLRRRRSRK